MTNVLRIALEGYNAKTDTDPRHFSLFTDQDNVLIKEHSRGSSSVNNGATLTVVHNIGYTPHCFVYAEISSGRYKLINGYDVFLLWRSFVEDNTLKIANNSGATGTAKYFIFYDNIG